MDLGNELPDKAEILHMGGWDHERDTAVGWVFGPCKVGAQYFSDGREPLVGGWTIAELRQMYESRTAA